MVNHFDDAPFRSGISHTNDFDVALLPVWLKFGRYEPQPQMARYRGESSTFSNADSNSLPRARSSNSFRICERRLKIFERKQN
jgi:hypothetical protein